jgi:hypothetical protein
MALSTTIQLAMAFSEQVYRRANTEQQLGNNAGPREGYEKLSGSLEIVDEQAKWQIDGTGRTYNEGFYYEKKGDASLCFASAPLIEIVNATFGRSSLAERLRRAA